MIPSKIVSLTNRRDNSPKSRSGEKFLFSSYMIDTPRGTSWHTGYSSTFSSLQLTFRFTRVFSTLYACMSVQGCMHVYSQRSAPCVTHQELVTLFSETGSHWDLGLAVCARLTGRELPQHWAYECAPSHSFYMYVKDGIQIFIVTGQALSKLSQLPSLLPSTF